MADDESTRRDDDIDPIEFLRRALAISPEDAAKVREDAAKRSAEDERRLKKKKERPGLWPGRSHDNGL